MQLRQMTSFLYSQLLELLQSIVSYIIPKNNEEKTTISHLYNAIRYSSDQEHLQKRSIDNSRIAVSTARGPTSDNSTSSTTSAPSVNVNFTAHTIKKSDLNGKSLKTGDLEPILKGLHKLREHSYKASNRSPRKTRNSNPEHIGSDRATIFTKPIHTQ